MAKTAAELFPHVKFSEDEAEWTREGGGWEAPYISGYRKDGGTIVLDGEFDAEGLRALADWMEGK